jgi:hypothetical protein
MSPSDAFRARLRFKVQKKLNLEAESHDLVVDDLKVVLSPQLPNRPIKNSDWLVFNARGFSSDVEARRFAHRLKLACEIASAATRLGIDTGKDIATSGFGKAVKDHVLQQTGVALRDNVHGIDVFVDDPTVRFGHIEATLTVHAEAEPFLTIVGTLGTSIGEISQRCRDALLLLNYALMRPKPVAQIVFAFSAVEMLGQDEEWTPSQRQLLGKLAALARIDTCGAVEERDEVAAAIERGTQRLGLRQGVLRLLASLGLQDLKKDWDRQYGERSTLVHGLAPEPGADYTQLAYRVVNLCGRILLTFISREVPAVREHIEIYFPRNT